MGNLTSNAGQVVLRGNLGGSQRQVSLLINARVHVPPQRLQAAVERCLLSTAGAEIEATVVAMRSFFPGRPQPTYRDGKVAGQ